MGAALFGRYIGHELHRALWQAHRDIYGSSGRRPYVTVGLPFVAIRPNTANAPAFTNNAYAEGIAHWSERARSSPHESIRRNAQRFSGFLTEDLQAFHRGLAMRRRPR